MRLANTSTLSRIGVPLLLVAGAVGVSVIVLCSNPERAATGPPVPVSNPTFTYPTYPSARQPPAVSADDADLVDDEVVVGVVVNGKARAYPLHLMGGAPQNHVINDLVAGSPVTVTLCDIGRCVRVFTDTGSKPLDISVAGMRDGDMILKVGDRTYSQKTGAPLDSGSSDAFPFREHSFELTTWQAWRQAHPQSDVSLGAAESDRSKMGAQ